MKKALAAIGLLAALAACKTRPPDCCSLPGIEMVRTQTQCADAWGYGNTSAETGDKLINYLRQQQVKILSVTLLSTGEQNTCMACTCSSGHAFHVRVLDQYKEQMLKLGFAVK